jgi:hypothetical protein
MVKTQSLCYHGYGKANLSVNYRNTDNPNKDMLFVKMTTYLKEVVVDVNQSTGFSKQALKQVNDVQSFTNTLIASPQKSIQTCCVIYLLILLKDNKSFELHKMNVLKSNGSQK